MSFDIFHTAERDELRHHVIVLEDRIDHWTEKYLRMSRHVADLERELDIMGHENLALKAAQQERTT